MVLVVRVVCVCGMYLVMKNVCSLVNVGIIVLLMVCCVCFCSCVCLVVGMLVGSFLNGVYSGDWVGFFSLDMVVMDILWLLSIVCGMLKLCLRLVCMLLVCWLK